MIKTQKYIKPSSSDIDNLTQAQYNRVEININNQ